MEKKIRVGIIGCGEMMGSHVRALHQVEGVEVTAFCDLIIQNAEKYAKMLNNGAYTTTKYRDMVDYVDAVLVATNHETHYDIGMFFALNDKHVLMEKPLCNTEEECMMLTKTCEEHNVTLMCAYPLPYQPMIIKLKELVDSGEYGKVMQMSIWTEQLTGEDSEYPKSNGTRGGGQFFSHGCHYVDLLLRFLGNPVQGAHLGTNVGTPWMLKEGTSTAIFKFENGALGYHGATWGARGTHLHWRIMIMMEKGLLELEQKDKRRIKLYSGNIAHSPGVVNPNYKKVLWEDDDLMDGKQTQHEIDHFIHCIRTGEKPITDGFNSTQSLRVIWRMYDAEKHNTSADLTGLGLRD